MDALDDVSGEELFGQMSLGGDLPHPVDWTALSVAERREELRRLWTWVVETAQAWPVQRHVLPPCWYRHESLIQVLSAARDAYLSAYHPTQPASAAADWMHVWDATVERLARWASSSSCKSGEHQADRTQRWVADKDVAAVAAAEFERFVDGS